MPMKKRSAAKKAARTRKSSAAGKKAVKTKKRKAEGRKGPGTRNQGESARTAVTTKKRQPVAAQAPPTSARWGVYIKEHNGKFRVEHHYMPKPDVEQPTTFDDEVTRTVGEAGSREEAERIKQEYENKLSIESENETDEDV